MTDPLEDMAYDREHDAFAARRASIVDMATEAHDSGDEERAQHLLTYARGMHFTGLHWGEEPYNQMPGEAPQ